MTENITEYFDELNNQLIQLERKYNPQKTNLHFEDEVIPTVDDQLFYELLKLSRKAIEIIKDEPDRYSNRTPYARGLFDFWCEYFIMVSSASIRVKKSANSDNFSKETIYSIIQNLIDISELSIIVSGDLYFRNREALGNTLLAFYSDDLINMVKKKKATIKSKNVRGFVDETAKAVERRRKVKANINKEDIDEAVADVCIQIIKEPLSYFSEADIQQLLVEELRKIETISKLYPTSVRKGKDSKGTFSTSLLYREYGGGGGRRIDIVIFDPEDVGEINDVNLRKDQAYLRPLYSFELGTEKTSDTAAHVNNDLAKLQSTKGTGYLIHFYKDVTQAPTGTKSREKTEVKIKNDYKQVFQTIQVERFTNVKILAILLRTYRDQKKMRGKCMIFDRQKQKWMPPTNISRDGDLRNAIQNQLK